MSDTEVRMDHIPTCSFCDTQASYDGKTYSGPWAYMCEAHFQDHGIGLGLGRGQKLIYDVEEPCEVSHVALSGTFAPRCDAHNLIGCTVCADENTTRAELSATGREFA